MEEVHYLEVQDAYYKEMYSVFNSPHVRHIRTDVKGEDFKDDLAHQTLLKEFLKARNNLKNYEFNKRYKI